MKVSKTILDKIIKEEVQLFLEACGCGAMPDEAGMSDPMVIPLESLPAEEYQDDDEVGELSKSDALELVSMIARKTSCPVTSNALMDVVHNLSDGEVGGEMFDLEHSHSDDDAWASGNVARVPDLGSLDSGAAFGLGHGIGSGDITDYEVDG